MSIIETFKVHILLFKMHKNPVFTYHFAPPLDDLVVHMPYFHRPNYADDITHLKFKNKQ